MARWLVLVFALAACSKDGDSCETDGDCGGEVCARTGICVAKGNVRVVHVTWTIQGQPPDAAACATRDPLEIDFASSVASVGFAPVPCAAGLYTIDKLPTDMIYVSLGPEGNATTSATIDALGHAQLDLP